MPASGGGASAWLACCSAETRDASSLASSSWAYKFIVVLRYTGIDTNIRQSVLDDVGHRSLQLVSMLDLIWSCVFAGFSLRQATRLQILGGRGATNVIHLGVHQLLIQCLHLHHPNHSIMPLHTRTCEARRSSCELI